MGRSDDVSFSLAVYNFKKYKHIKTIFSTSFALDARGESIMSAAIYNVFENDLSHFDIKKFVQPKYIDNFHIYIESSPFSKKYEYIDLQKIKDEFGSEDIFLIEINKLDI